MTDPENQGLHTADSAVVVDDLEYGMSYYLGRQCWHVVGYVNGDVMCSVLLCGARPSEYGIGGGTSDVLASDMRVCKTCDRATGGGATGDVDRLRVLRCGRCNDHGLMWDPRVHGNVVPCHHGSPIDGGPESGR